jgi:anti-anti-sigma factor
MTFEGTIEVENDGGVWVLTLRGEHDLSTRPSLDEELRRRFDAGSRVVADLTEAEFIDSTVLRALADGRRQAIEHAEHDFAIVAPPACAARRLLSLTGIDQAVPTFDTRADAVAALAG